MTQVILYVVLALIVLIAILCIYAATRPSAFVVTRSAKMKAPPMAPFALVNDFKKWPQWSPWEHVDPNLKRTFDGPPEGKDSSYAWEGNGKVGKGSMKIAESKPGELIKIDLRFEKPFVGYCPTEFKFTSEGNETLVTWTMTGEYTFVPKLIGVFLNMEKLNGGFFEKGLADMKKGVESPTTS
jgi:hypothetical protein